MQLPRWWPLAAAGAVGAYLLWRKPEAVAADPAPAASPYYGGGGGVGSWAGGAPAPLIEGPGGVVLPAPMPITVVEPSSPRIQASTPAAAAITAPVGTVKPPPQSTAEVLSSGPRPAIAPQIPELNLSPGKANNIPFVSTQGVGVSTGLPQDRLPDRYDANRQDLQTAIAGRKAPTTPPPIPETTPTFKPTPGATIARWGDGSSSGYSVGSDGSILAPSKSFTAGSSVGSSASGLFGAPKPPAPSPTPVTAPATWSPSPVTGTTAASAGSSAGAAAGGFFGGKSTGTPPASAPPPPPPPSSSSGGTTASDRKIALSGVKGGFR